MNNKQRVEIRDGSINDIEAAYNLVVELAVYEKEPEAVTASLENYIQDFNDGIFQFLVAQSGNEIVGIAIYYMTYSTWKGKMLHLEDFIVTQQHRRKGIGELLFNAFVARARELDCVLTRWQVLDWNQTALNFYEKIGATIDKDWWTGKLYL